MNSELQGVMGVRIDCGKIIPILDLRTAARSRTTFTTVADQQRRAIFQVHYREDRIPDWVLIDSLALDHIPPARAGDPDLSVDARVDQQGRICLRIEDPATAKGCLYLLRLEDLARRCREARGTGLLSAPEARPARERPKKAGWGWALVALSAAAVAASLVAVTKLLPGPSVETAPRQPAPECPVAPLPSVKAVETHTGGKAVGLQPAMEKPVKGAAPGVEEAAEPGGDAPATDPSLAWYSIVWGDVLWRISERFYGDPGLSTELAKTNGLPDPDVIIAGESIVLPASLSGRGRARLPEEAQQHE